VGNPKSIRREIEASLRRLNVERIDLYQMHWPPEDGTPIEEYWGTMLELEREGKARAVGLSNHTAAQLEIAERIGHVDTLQPPFSLIHREAAASELPWCAKHHTGVIVYSPMQSGLLTGSFSKSRAAKLTSDDWRSRSSDFQSPALDRNLAIEWTLAWPGVTGAIVGARSPQQVDGWIAAASDSLTREDLDEIANAIERTGAGRGPVHPQ
jgi:aryl-alcohol dehydrogenase-like predicted oxidoreductase